LNRHYFGFGSVIFGAGRKLLLTIGVDPNEGGTKFNLGGGSKIFCGGGNFVSGVVDCFSGEEALL
jgi:hypothetical protein